MTKASGREVEARYDEFVLYPGEVEKDGTDDVIANHTPHGTGYRPVIEGNMLRPQVEKKKFFAKLIFCYRNSRVGFYY